MQVWWITILAFAIVIAYADGFWVTSLQGAVGAIGRNEDPFHRWVRDSTLMLPLFFLAVLVAVRMARRAVGHRRAFVKYGTAAVLIVVLTSGVAVAEVAASSAYDYHLQTQQLQLEHQLMGHTHVAGESALLAQSDAGTACTGLCSSVRETFNVHVRAVLYSSVLLLMTNFVLVLWVMALRGGRVWRRPPTSSPSAAPVAHEELSMA